MTPGYHADEVKRKLKPLTERGRNYQQEAFDAYALIEQLEGEVAKLQAFKTYTHQRMDELNVPHEVPSPHTDAGCRIGGRFDYVVAELASAREALRLVADWFKAAQANAIEYLNSDHSNAWFVNQMLWSLDGPTQREVQDAINAALFTSDTTEGTK